jgi:hypothetical protein
MTVIQAMSWLALLGMALDSLKVKLFYTGDITTPTFVEHPG